MAAGIAVKLTLNDSLFLAGLRNATSKVQAFGFAAAHMGLDLVERGFHMVAEQAIEGSKRIFESAESLIKMHRQTGISVSGLFVLKQAFEEAGVSSEHIGAQIGRMEKNLYAASKGNQALREAVASTGLSLSVLVTMKPEKAFMAIGKAIDGLPDLQKQAAAIKLFGKSGVEMLPVFAELKNFDSKNIEGLAGAMEKNAEKLKAAGDAVKRLKVAYSGLFVGLAVSIGPFIEKIATAFSNVKFLTMGMNLNQTIVKAIRLSFETMIKMFSPLAEVLAASMIGAFGTFYTYLDATLTFIFTNAVAFFANALRDALNSLVGLFGYEAKGKPSKGISWKEAETQAAFHNPITKLAHRMLKDAKQNMLEIGDDVTGWADRHQGGDKTTSPAIKKTWFQQRLEDAQDRNRGFGAGMSTSEWSESVKKGEYVSPLSRGSSGLTSAGDAARRKEAGKDKAGEGVNKTNNLLEQIKKMMGDIEVE